MKVLVLCGYFEAVHQGEVTLKTKTWVENAANTFQKRLLTGLEMQGVNLSVLSAPFIGAWPKGYNDIYFRGFEQEQEEKEFNLRYVEFNNIWGFRNISRTKALKREVRKFASEECVERKVIVVYSPHTPFLEAAVYAKKIDSLIQICLVCPDLPQYMNLSVKKHPVYDFFKTIDIKRFNNMSGHIDSFVLLTEYMHKKLGVGERPFIVIEGIFDGVCRRADNTASGKKIAYAGKLLESFGVMHLVEAFKRIEDDDVSLEICGGGELREYIEDEGKEDTRIHYHGILSAEDAREMILGASVLVNPRKNDDEYTKYSFPSKNIEYLQTGNAVVAYMLDGMPEIYCDFLEVPEDNTTEALTKSLKEALYREDIKKRTIMGQNYLINERCPEMVGRQIIDLIKSAFV